MDDNRRALLRSALSLFSARGYDAVGVKAICDDCGLTKPTLYHYFGSKNGLLRAILEEEWGRLFTRLERGLTYRHDLVNSLDTLAIDYLSFAHGNRLFLGFILSQTLFSPEAEAARESEPYRSKLMGRFEYLFLQAAGDHGNMKGREKKYAVTFWGMLNAHFGVMLQEKRAYAEHEIREAVHQFMHGIFS